MLFFLQITVSQSRFFYPQSNETQTSDSLWQIPLTYTTDKAPLKPTRALMNSSAMPLTVSDFKWLKFNHNLTGYYRVSFVTMFDVIARYYTACPHQPMLLENRICYISANIEAYLTI